MSGSVLIVGGGIGGMTLALALAQKKIASTVLEQAPFFRETGAGILLCPNVFKMFARLGLTEKMMEIASFPENLIYADGLTGEKFFHVPMGQAIVDRFRFPYGSFHREELLRTLVKECQSYSQIELITSAKVVQVEESKGQVFAHLENGQKYAGPCLIGCDGLWSTVRQAIFNDGPPRFSGHITHRGVVEIERLSPHLRPNNVLHWDRPDAHLVQYPIGKKGLFNIVAVCQTYKPRNPEETGGDAEELQERFAGSRPEILELLQFVDTTRHWMLYDRIPAKEWSKGRMTLLGDACHPTLPHLTQGAGMAIEDAVVLARKMELNGTNWEKAFQDYQENRYLRTAHVQIFSKAYGEAHHAHGVARELRNFLVGKRTLQENYDWLGMLYKGIEIE